MRGGAVEVVFRRTWSAVTEVRRIIIITARRNNNGDNNSMQVPRAEFQILSACTNRCRYERGAVFGNAIIYNIVLLLLLLLLLHHTYGRLYCARFWRVRKTFSRPDDDSLLMDFAPSRRRPDRAVVCTV